MENLAQRVDQILEQTGGILKLRPNFVRRFYKDGGRLGLSSKPGGTYLRTVKMWRPERWIASTVTTTNPNPVSGEGLSFLDVPGLRLSLQNVLQVRAETVLGSSLSKQHGAQFPVLNKIFDPDDPIVFHFHARDEDVKRYPQHFSGHRLGKDEAYYFLPSPKRRVPYTHIGLRPGVTAREFRDAIARGGDHALELSPAAYQHFEQGFYVPAGIPHRPGTALTLEIQQPSDVYTLLETHSGDRALSPEQIHPGFSSLGEALRFIDLKQSEDPDIIEKQRLVPRAIPETRQKRHGEEHWIFPPEVSRKFSGKRLRVTGSFESVEDSPYALLVWSGEGDVDGRRVKAGEEYLFSDFAARRPHVIRRIGTATLEVFKLFPPRSRASADGEA